MIAQDGRKACYQIRPVAEFGVQARSPDGLQSSCRQCERERLQRRKHGLTSEEKAALAETQGGCATCSRTDPGAKGWVVDHDRKCCPGETSCPRCRRGVLCHWCNTALGYAEDDPVRLRRMADYIESGVRLS